MVVTIKISERVKERLEKLAEKMGGVSINTVVETLLDHYETGITKDKPVKSRIDVMLINKIDVDYIRCLKCGRRIQVGEEFRYIRIDYEDGSRDVIRICMECSLNATLLKRYYVEKRKLEVIVRELRKEANELVEQVEELKKQADILKIKADIAVMIKDTKELLRSVANNDLRTTLVMVLERLDDINTKLDKLEPIPLKPQARPQTQKPQAREPSRS
jgi:antitoxin component of RelBE/YafQ-DinJ toxin-antitoxin module